MSYRTFGGLRRGRHGARRLALDHLRELERRGHDGVRQRLHVGRRLAEKPIFFLFCYNNNTMIKGAQ